MRILVAINGNVREWQEGLEPSPDRPRLPLPYAFGAALMARGAMLSCIDLNQAAGRVSPGGPFDEAFPAGQLARAMGAADAAALWGPLAVKAILNQIRLGRPRRRVVFSTYVWNDVAGTHPKTRVLCGVTRAAARWARAVVVMTREQEGLAAARLDGRVPVVRLQVGIDTRFYSDPSSFSDVPANYRSTVESLLREPYVIMPGDELRRDSDALEVVSGLGVRLVRVAQYAWKSRTDKLKAEIETRGLRERVLVFERIHHRFLRFLLRNAAAYVGLVDSSWQPAGWTVACEALASGLPAVLYDGLVSRELRALGGSPEWLKVAPPGDVPAFRRELDSVMGSRRGADLMRPEEFARTRLDLVDTGRDFAGRFFSALERTGAHGDVEPA